MLIPDSDPTVGPSETVTGHPCQEDGAGDGMGGEGGGDDWAGGRGWEGRRWQC